MKYKGIELEPITTPQIFDPPKDMLVWDGPCGTPLIERVCAITIRKPFPVITVESCYDYCAEIPKPKRATKLQLMEWLSRGRGIYKRSNGIGYTFTNASAFEAELEEEVEQYILIRPFGTKEWVEPTLENMGMGDK